MTDQYIHNIGYRVSVSFESNDKLRTFQRALEEKDSWQFVCSEPPAPFVHSLESACSIMKVRSYHINCLRENIRRLEAALIDEINDVYGWNGPDRKEFLEKVSDSK